MAAESDFQRLLNLRRAGVDPNVIRAFGPTGAEMLSGAGERVQNLAGQAQQAVGELATPAGRGKMRAATGFAGTALGVLPGAIQTTQQQGILPGIASGAAGLAAGAAVAPVSPPPSIKNLTCTASVSKSCADLNFIAILARGLLPPTSCFKRP